MDLAPTTSQEEFRAECRSWLERELPWEYGVGFPPMFDDLDQEVAFLRDWQEKLAGAQMVGVSWPRETGAGASNHSTTSSCKKNWRAHGHLNW